MIDEAERQRGPLAPAQLRYQKHDLRTPIAEGDFDVALNIFSSLGYGTEEDDLAILETLRRALKKGGRLVVETMHRDAFVARLASSSVPPVGSPTAR